MGFWNRYFTTVFKGPRALAFKQRWNVRIIVNNLHEADTLIFKKLPKDVEQLHRVTKATEEEKKALADLKKASEAVTALVYEAELEEKKIIGQIEEVRQQIVKKNAQVHDPQLKTTEGRIVKGIVDAMEEVKKEDMGEARNLMALINEIDSGSINLRQSLMTRFKSMDAETVLEKVAARSEASKAKRAVIALEKIVSQLKAPLKLGNQGQVEEKNMQRFVTHLQRVRKVIKTAYFEVYSLKKRGILWMMKILYDLYTLRDLGYKWISMNEMPSQSHRNVVQKVADTVRDLEREIRTLSQGYTILTKSLDREERAILSSLN